MKFINLGALLLIVIAAVAASPECKGCQGKRLVDTVKVFEDKQTCFFGNKHRYLLKFKLQLLNFTSEQLEILIDSTNEKAPVECQTKFETEECDSDDIDANAVCHIRNLKNLANVYEGLEQCADGPLDITQLELVFKILFGQIVGWKHIHDTC